jgi:serpin B
MVLKRGHDIVSPRYAALLHDKYRTQLFRDAGLAEVNGWVRRQTEGKIEKIVDEILPGEVLAILNAVYFKATWQSGFRRSDTRDADFQVSRSVAARVPTMHQEGDFAMLMRPDYQAIRLPYRNAALAMVIVMPNDVDGATKLVRDLDADALADLFNALTTARAGKVELALPRFTARFKASLNEALATAGIRRAFGLGSADFSGMTGDGLLHVVISRVEHSAFIDVTEEGTEAAAVTGGVMLASASPRFAVDRPFLFYITDSATGAILVQGRISDPRPQS